MRELPAARRCRCVPSISLCGATRLDARSTRSKAISRLTGFDEPVHAVFIRAPWVERVGADVQVLARAAGHPVAVRQGAVLATAFHPEVTGDRRIHRLFVDIVNGRR